MILKNLTVLKKLAENSAKANDPQKFNCEPKTFLQPSFNPQVNQTMFNSLILFLAKSDQNLSKNYEKSEQNNGS